MENIICYLFGHKLIEAINFEENTFTLDCTRCKKDALSLGLISKNGCNSHKKRISIESLKSKEDYCLKIELINGNNILFGLHKFRSFNCVLKMKYFAVTIAFFSFVTYNIHKTKMLN